MQGDTRASALICSVSIDRWLTSTQDWEDKMVTARVVLLLKNLGGVFSWYQHTKMRGAIFLVMVVIFHYTGHVIALNRRGEPLCPSSSSHLNVAWFHLVWLHQASQAETALLISHAPITIFQWGFLSVNSSNLTVEICLCIPYGAPFFVHALCGIGLQGKKASEQKPATGLWHRFSRHEEKLKGSGKGRKKLKHGIS